MICWWLGRAENARFFSLKSAGTAVLVHFSARMLRFGVGWGGSSHYVLDMTRFTFPSAILGVWGGGGADNVPRHLRSRDAKFHVHLYMESYVTNVSC